MQAHPGRTPSPGAHHRRARSTSARPRQLALGPGAQPLARRIATSAARLRGSVIGPDIFGRRPFAPAAPGEECPCRPRHRRRRRRRRPHGRRRAQGADAAGGRHAAWSLDALHACGRRDRRGGATRPREPRCGSRSARPPGVRWWPAAPAAPSRCARALRAAAARARAPVLVHDAARPLVTPALDRGGARGRRGRRRGDRGRARGRHAKARRRGRPDRGNGRPRRACGRAQTPQAFLGTGPAGGDRGGRGRRPPGRRDRLRLAGRGVGRPRAPGGLAARPTSRSRRRRTRSWPRPCWRHGPR